MHSSKRCCTSSTTCGGTDCRSVKTVRTVNAASLHLATGLSRQFTLHWQCKVLTRPMSLDQKQNPLPSQMQKASVKRTVKKDVAPPRRPRTWPTAYLKLRRSLGEIRCNDWADGRNRQRTGTDGQSHGCAWAYRVHRCHCESGSAGAFGSPPNKKTNTEHKAMHNTLSQHGSG